MKNIILITVLIIGLILQSCQENFDTESDVFKYPSGDIVLQHRSPMLPQSIKSKEIKKPSRSKEGITQCNSDEYLGYSYFLGNTFLGNPQNTGGQVLDLEIIKSKSPKRVSAKQINQATYDYFLYDDTASYAKKLSENKKFTSSFSINIFNAIKIGRKKTHTYCFKDSITSSSRVVYGELNICNKNSTYSLSAMSSDLKYYARECLSPLFLDHLYNNTISELLIKYGETVMTGYITGGRLFALYAGLHKESSRLTIKARDMGLDLNASVFWNSDSVSGSIKVGNSKGYAEMKSNKIDQTQVNLTCIGGNISSIPMQSTFDLEKSSYDLSTWWQSLSDKNTHNIIDIANNGLVPLSAVILEKNFQRRIDDTVGGFLQEYTDFQTPYIEIVKVMVRNTSGPIYEVAPVLNTRNGDKIVLSDGAYQSQTDSELRGNLNNSVYDTKVMEILPKLREYFPEIRIVKNYDTKYNLSIRVPLCIRMDGFDFTTFVRHREDNGMIYLYDRNTKLAFSYYEDVEGDILDAYKLFDWLYSIPDEDAGRPLSMSALSNYTIIGL